MFSCAPMMRRLTVLRKLPARLQQTQLACGDPFLYLAQ
jgi:hypothetical protein